MKKLITAIILICSLNVSGFAHDNGHYNDACISFFGLYKYMAHASVDMPNVLVWQHWRGGGQWVLGTQNLCDQQSMGCTRPQTALCLGVHFFSDRTPPLQFALAGWTFNFSGSYEIAHFTTDYRLVPGIVDGLPVDPGKLAAIDKNGVSQAKINGNIDIDPVNQLLNISNINVQVGIVSGTNYFSKFRIAVVAVDTTISDSATVQNENNLNITNIVLDGDITVDNSGVKIDGFLNGLIPDIPVKYIDTTDSMVNTLIGINISGFTASALLPALGPNQIYRVVTYSDGGFDWSLVAPDTPQVNNTGDTIIYLPGEGNGGNGGGPGNKNILLPQSSPQPSVFTVQTFPNPATGSYSIVLNNMIKDEKAKIELFDITGKLIETIFDQNVSKENLALNNLSTVELPNGVYIIKVTQNNITANSRLIIQK